MTLHTCISFSYNLKFPTIIILTNFYFCIEHNAETVYPDKHFPVPQSDTVLIYYNTNANLTLSDPSVDYRNVI